MLRGYRLVEVPENKELRERLADKSLDELTLILAGYKQLHNTTDVDTCKRAIRAIEIEADVIKYIGNKLNDCLFAYFNTFKHYLLHIK